ncbi:MAG: flagellar biosynthetic protein FliO [Marinisporobacter sp.]|jgi:flagellar biosynthetic protein FliO|nr:flagellar biosynthetic protein FliO [Marinisporobacter sp.]
MIIIPDAKYFGSVLFVFCFVIIAAYYVTRLIAKNGTVLTKGKNMKVIEKISLGVDKSIYFIGVGKFYYILAISKQNIELIDKIREEDIDMISQNRKHEKMDNKFDTLLDQCLYEDDIFLKEQPGKFEGSTDTMMNKIKEMKRRIQGFKHYKDGDEIK